MSNERIDEALRQWGRYARERQQLERLGYCRSCKDPQAEFAEWLVKELSGGDLEPSRSHPGFDVAKDGRRIQVRKFGRKCSNQRIRSIDDAGLTEMQRPHRVRIRYLGTWRSNSRLLLQLRLGAT